jgi:hypothetical protein
VDAAKRTQSYSLTDCSILCDTLVVSSELQRLFAEHMLEGTMPLSISSWSTTRHEVPTTGKFDLQTTRSLALLKTVFVTFDADDVANRLGANAAEKNALTSATLLFNPQNGKAMNTAADTMEWQLVIGARTWPVFPVRGTPETYYHLRQALDQNRYGFLNITKENYLTKEFIIGCDVEKGAGTIDGATRAGAASPSPCAFATWILSTRRRRPTFISATML